MEEQVIAESQEAEYRAFLAAGTVKMQRCGACRYVRHPARWICPQCLSEQWSWETLAGGGRVETFVWYFESLDPRFVELPYNVAIVQLDEGPRVITNVLEVAFGDLSAGQAVTAVVKSGPDGAPLLCFRPAQRAPA